MALIVCPECEKTVSDKSEKCIHCGYPMTDTKTDNTPEVNIKPLKAQIIKALIQDKKLSYIDRKIESINEVVELYSDSELEQISELELPNNAIKTLDGIERFYLKKLDLSGNQLTIIDKLPKFGHTTIYTDAHTDTTLNFSKNISLKEFSNEAIDHINNRGAGFHSIRKIALIFDDCPNLNLVPLAKIDFQKFFIPNEKAEVILVIDSKLELPLELKEKGFIRSNNILFSNYKNVWELTKSEPIKGNAETVEYPNNTINQESKGKHNITHLNFGVLNWLHLLAPYGMAIAAYLLGKKLDISETNFGDCLGMSCLMVVIFSFLQFINRRERTGRFYQSKHGEKFVEYNTIYANANVSSYFWKITLFHILIIIISFTLAAKGNNSPKSNEEYQGSISNVPKLGSTAQVSDTSTVTNEDIVTIIGIDTMDIIDKIIEYYKNEGLQNQCNMKKEIAPSKINLSFYSKDYPQDISVFSVDIMKNFIVGDINNDGKSDVFTQQQTSGGWAAGNVGWRESFAFISQNNKYTIAISPKNTIDFGCKNGGSYVISEIKNGMLIGESFCYDKDDPNCCPSLHFKIKLKLSGKKLILLDKTTAES